jgi:hypothetical protein
MPGEQVHLVVRKPLADIEEELRQKYGVRSTLTDVAIEQDALVFTFEGSKSAPPTRLAKSESDPAPVPDTTDLTRKRRKRRVRNRMKTRGWDVVAKFVNSRGQPCTIYRPFFDVLSTQKLKRREAYSAIRDILVANGNNPKPSSVEYFLNNTMEYLQSHQGASE